MTKPYTQVSPVNEQGSARFIVKVYRPDDTVDEGDDILVAGPIGMYRYLGDGVLQFKDQVLPKKK